ncbi:MAG: phosphate/phosphite/phosphonate ABC transporter substrate-binding protein [Desulfosarcina sp.]|nr:phosphate/phosphite/phosphonate ABC transporter substrate-binding protein [Desulfobacterales bacterium]
MGCLALLLFFLAGLACSRDETSRRIDFSQREDVTIVQEEAGRLTYAYLPQFSHAVSFQRHYRLVRYLREQTGLDLEQIFPDTFDEHMRMVGQGKIDISFSNPFIYVVMAQDYCARAFARIIESGGHERFRGEIIVRADNPAIRTIADCRGKRWVAVDPFSAGGYLYALGLFRDHGIFPEDFAEIAFAPGPGGKQEKVILAVQAGQYDVGSVREGALAVVADKIDPAEIRVIDRTGWYPGWVYAAREGLDPQIVQRVRQALVALDADDPDQRGILEKAHITAIVPSNDTEFDPVRKLWTRVGGKWPGCGAAAANPEGRRP